MENYPPHDYISAASSTAAPAASYPSADISLRYGSGYERPIKMKHIHDFSDRKRNINPPPPPTRFLHSDDEYFFGGCIFIGY